LKYQERRHFDYYHIQTSCSVLLVFYTLGRIVRANFCGKHLAVHSQQILQQEQSNEQT
jgi:hypothetical protein